MTNGKENRENSLPYAAQSQPWQDGSITTLRGMNPALHLLRGKDKPQCAICALRIAWGELGSPFAWDESSWALVQPANALYG
jgi:hypothetical protein